MLQEGLYWSALLLLRLLLKVLRCGFISHSREPLSESGLGAGSGLRDSLLSLALRGGLRAGSR